MTRAEKMIAFIETLRTPDGAGVGQPFVLRGWQKAIIREVYDAEDGRAARGAPGRAVHVRKNGKTALRRAVPCAPVRAGSRQERPAHSLAHDREQASVLFS
ncbi:MAG: hypothetical protein ACLSHC_13865 [Bilophila wadsworthia]